MKAKVFTGITLTLFLVATLFTAIPIPVEAVTYGDPIKVAIVGPEGWIQFDGLWVGAVIARDYINGLGGIVTDGVTHLIELRAVDEHAVPEPDPSAAIVELDAALSWGADFVIGGFRTECVAPMVSHFLDKCKERYDDNQKTPIWIIAGAATDALIDCRGRGGAGCHCVRCDYARSRYMFRVTPMCGIELVAQIGGVLRGLILPYKLGPIYGGDWAGTDYGTLWTPEDYPLYGGLYLNLSFPDGVPIWEHPIKTYLVLEDLTWTLTMQALLKGYKSMGVTIFPEPPASDSLLGPNVEIVGTARTHALTPNFEPVFDAIDDSGAHLIIHVYSAVTGVDFIKTWGERETDAVCVGINVESQMQEFWQKVDGKCEYETFLASVGTGTDINPDAEPYGTKELWDLYKEKSGKILSDFWGTPMPSTYPVYTMWGSYDAIIGLKEQIETFDSWPLPGDWNNHTNTLIADTEDIERSGTLGRFKYTQYHDVSTDPGAATPYWQAPHYVRAQIPQWQNGKLEVVWPQDQVYSRRYKVPSRMYSLSDTDVAGNPDVAGVADGYVNELDMGYVGYSWQARYGDEMWNIEVDLNNDGIINIRDASKVGKDYGEGVGLPPP